MEETYSTNPDATAPELYIISAWLRHLVCTRGIILSASEKEHQTKGTNHVEDGISERCVLLWEQDHSKRLSLYRNHT